MRLKPLTFLLSFILPIVTFADGRHIYPKDLPNATRPAQSVQQQKAQVMAGACGIRVYNKTLETVVVSGVLDDGRLIVPFKIYWYEISPAYIDLFNYVYGYCPFGANVLIESSDWFAPYPVYSEYTLAGMDIAVDYFGRYLKAEVKAN